MADDSEMWDFLSVLKDLQDYRGTSTDKWRRILERGHRHSPAACKAMADEGKGKVPAEGHGVVSALKQQGSASAAPLPRHWIQQLDERSEGEDGEPEAVGHHKRCRETEGECMKTLLKHMELEGTVVVVMNSTPLKITFRRTLVDEGLREWLNLVAKITNINLRNGYFQGCILDAFLGAAAARRFGKGNLQDY